MPKALDEEHTTKLNPVSKLQFDVQKFKETLAREYNQYGGIRDDLKEVFLADACSLLQKAMNAIIAIREQHRIDRIKDQNRRRSEVVGKKMYKPKT